MNFKFSFLALVVLFGVAAAAYSYETVYVPSYTAYSYAVSTPNYYTAPYYHTAYSYPSYDTYYYVYTPVYYGGTYGAYNSYSAYDYSYSNYNYNYQNYNYPSYNYNYREPDVVINNYNNYCGSANCGSNVAYSCKIRYVAGIAYNDC